MPQATNRGAHMDLSWLTLLKQHITSISFGVLQFRETEAGLLGANMLLHIVLQS
jgi:hypothetical protein